MPLVMTVTTVRGKRVNMGRCSFCPTTLAPDVEPDDDVLEITFEGQFRFRVCAPHGMEMVGVMRATSNVLEASAAAIMAAKKEEAR